MAELLSSFFILGSDRDTGRAPVQPGVSPPSAASFAADIPRAAGDPGLVGLSLGLPVLGFLQRHSGTRQSNTTPQGDGGTGQGFNPQGAAKRQHSCSDLTWPSVDLSEYERVLRCCQAPTHGVLCILPLRKS